MSRLLGSSIPTFSIICKHKARIDVTLPDHDPCDRCCQAVKCPAHDASNPVLARLKTDLGKVMESFQTSQPTSIDNVDAQLDQHLKAIALAADFLASLDLTQASRLVEVQDSLDKVGFVEI